MYIVHILYCTPTLTPTPHTSYTHTQVDPKREPQLQQQTSVPSPSINWPPMMHSMSSPMLHHHRPPSLVSDQSYAMVIMSSCSRYFTIVVLCSDSVTMLYTL